MSNTMDAVEDQQTQAGSADGDGLSLQELRRRLEEEIRVFKLSDYLTHPPGCWFV
jgi:hypothetical protein